MRSVAFSEWLRPWSNAGITCFLSEYPVDLTRLAPEFVPQPSPEAPPRLPHGVPPSSPGSLKQSHGSSNPQRLGASGQVQGDERRARPFGGAGPSQKHPSPSASRVAASPQSGEESGSPFATDTPLPMVEWPVPFQEYFNRVVPSPVMWCYEALGEDLFGEANESRSSCLKSLIGKLQFPKGTSVFWPPSVPAVQDVLLSQRVLLQALQELFPKLVILLGIGPTLSFFHGENKPLPFTQRLFKGHMVVFLPDFSELLENPSLFNQSVHYLRAIVAQLSIV